MRPLLAFPRCQSGGAAAEMALMLPMLMTLLFGGFEAGNYFFMEHQVLKGLREGARYASRQSFVDVTCTTITSAAVTRIKNVTRTGQVSGGTSRLSGWVDSDILVRPSCPTTSYATGIYQGAANAPRITIQTHVRYPSLFQALGVINGSFYLNGKQQAAVMGL